MIELKIKISQNENILETEVNIQYPSKCDQETYDLLRYLEKDRKIIFGLRNDRKYRISLYDVYYIEYVDEKTFLYLESDVYLSHNKLYEWEELLKDTSFVRISKTTIVNIDYLKFVRHLLGGKMEITFINDESLVVNRHYLKSFKNKFGL